jgi:ATP-dependent helicase HrpB
VVIAVSALQSRACSQAAAKQRSGRAGRTVSHSLTLNLVIAIDDRATKSIRFDQAAGICYRLYTKLDYETRLQATIPEILRADLASAFLQLLAWGQNPAEFDYLDAPERASRKLREMKPKETAR